MKSKLIGHVKDGTRRGGAVGSRRGATALILVIALLGMLFVIGVTFLKTTNFEHKRIEREKKSESKQSVFESVTQLVGVALRNDFVDAFGIPYRADQSDALVRDVDPLPNAWDFRVAYPSYGQSIGVHPVMGELEPHCFDGRLDACGLGNNFGFDFPSAFGSVFYVDNNGNSKPNTFQSRYNMGDNFTFRFRTGMEGKAGARQAVDTDGDGINDARQFNLKWLGLAEAQLKRVLAMVNDPLGIERKAYIGIRVVDHGGMVNMSDGHATLVQAILSDRVDEFKPREELAGVMKEWKPPYEPQIEEPLLRRRHFIAPREVSPSRLHGNPLLGGDDDDSRGLLGPLLLPAVDPRKANNAPWWRWWPLTYDETIPNNDDVALWFRRMTRSNSSGGDYDRRHVLTTVSHDDLLMRGGWTNWWTDLDNNGKLGPGDSSPVLGQEVRRDVNEDWIEQMENLFALKDEDGPPPSFDYHLYPQLEYRFKKDKSGNPVKDEDGNLVIERDPLDGRRLLSLPWINDELMAGAGIDGVRLERGLTVRAERAVNLIQAAFTMLLLNARGEELYQWFPPEPPPPAPAPLPRSRYNKIARTAASLTANLIDFADSDSIPTRVAVRYSHPGSDDISKKPNFGKVRKDDFGVVQEYAYGLERQPYITEIAAVVTADGNGDVVVDESAWVVELFNPYLLDDISLEDFGLYLAPKGADFPSNLNGSEPRFFGFTRRDVVPRLTKNLTGGFAVAYAAGVDIKRSLESEFDRQARQFEMKDPKFSFDEGSIVYLVRKYTGGPKDVYYPVDQFEGQEIGRHKAGEETRFSDERMLEKPDINETLVWTFTVPMDEEFDLLGGDKHSLGTFNKNFVDPDIRPVEVNFANSGDLKSAFPTTGSMLLLMRHANFMSVDDESLNEAFTDKLLDEFKQIDNGRLPVFDDEVTGTDSKPSGGAILLEYKLYRHHVDPRKGRELEINDPDPEKNPQNPFALWYLPGGSQYLPWGLLVFDYFTALPLESPRPLRYNDRNYDPAAGPRVDMDGLRVHGRINIQSAPWSVLSGLPLMPANKIPTAFRAKVRKTAQLADQEAVWVGKELAQAIVAYRDGRNIVDQDDNTLAGKYHEFERELDKNRELRSRPGTGFMTVGELLNVRRIDAITEGDPQIPWSSLYRMDAGVTHRKTDLGKVPYPVPKPDKHNSYRIDNPQEDFIEAVSLMVALGDWVTTRSHVFTVYGVLRGGGTDEEVDKINHRAIRFQETLDRLPTVAGIDEERPVRIGERKVTLYRDAYND